MWYADGCAANGDISVVIDRLIIDSVNAIGAGPAAFGPQVDRGILTYLYIIAGVPVGDGIITFVRNNAD